LCRDCSLSLSLSLTACGSGGGGSSHHDSQTNTSQNGGNDNGGSGDNSGQNNNGSNGNSDFSVVGTALYTGSMEYSSDSLTDFHTTTLPQGDYLPDEFYLLTFSDGTFGMGFRNQIYNNEWRGAFYGTGSFKDFTMNVSDLNFNLFAKNDANSNLKLDGGVLSLTTAVMEPDAADEPFVKGTFIWNGDATHLNVNFNKDCDLGTGECDVATGIAINGSAGYSSDDLSIVPFDLTRIHQGDWVIQSGKHVADDEAIFTISDQGVLTGTFYSFEEDAECTFTGTLTPSSDKSYFTIAATYGGACQNWPSFNGKGVFTGTAASDSELSFIFFTTDGDVFSGGQVIGNSNPGINVS
jgi:hypothetical protein